MNVIHISESSSHIVVASRKKCRLIRGKASEKLSGTSNVGYDILYIDLRSPELVFSASIMFDVVVAVSNRAGVERF